MDEYCQNIVLEAAPKWHPVNSSVQPPRLKNPVTSFEYILIIHMSFKVKEKLLAFENHFGYFKILAV